MVFGMDPVRESTFPICAFIQHASENEAPRLCAHGAAKTLAASRGTKYPDIKNTNTIVKHYYMDLYKLGSYINARAMALQSSFGKKAQDVEKPVRKISADMLF